MRSDEGARTIWLARTHHTIGVVMQVPIQVPIHMTIGDASAIQYSGLRGITQVRNIDTYSYIAPVATLLNSSTDAHGMVKPYSVIDTAMTDVTMRFAMDISMAAFNNLFFTFTRKIA